MAKFWLATFAPQAAGTRAAAPPAAPDQIGGWAIEVIQEEKLGEFAVLLSRVDNIEVPKKLSCAVGFANGAKACSIWRDRGFPIVDAMIDNPDAKLRIRSACFLESEQINYDSDLISIPGITLAAPSGKSVAPPDAFYEQSQEAADYVFPATWIRRRQVSWSPRRSSTIAITPQKLALKVLSTRFPDLTPLRSENVIPKAVWYGTMELPTWPPTFPSEHLHRVSRAQEFGVPPFQFDDVEVLVFRLNLDELGIPDKALRARLLNKMIERLNFHLEPLDAKQRPAGSPVIRNPIPDFRYQPASPTLIVELVRYGKMRLKEALPPLRPHDYQSQHELVVRVLVGRVDEDAAQAHSPAAFVPAIFVDNPWSKIVGRTVQGFDKWMADFCVMVGGKLRRLRPDGRLSATSEKPEELASIKEICLVNNTGRELSKRAIVKLECPFNGRENWEASGQTDLSPASKRSSLVPLRWRQDDFADALFRRSFARSAIPAAFRKLRSVQVSPIGEEGLLERWKAETTLIEGTFIVEEVPEVVVPDRIATLTLCSEKTAPRAWKTMCLLFGIPEGKEGSISLIPGNWYRMRCSMELTIRDGVS